jgi:hypothetical protein
MNGTPRALAARKADFVLSAIIFCSLSTATYSTPESPTYGRRHPGAEPRRAGSGLPPAAHRRDVSAEEFRPKNSEVLARCERLASCSMYETALRALDELPGQIARAEHALRQRRDCAQ